MNIRDNIIAAIRTGVAGLVGLALTWLVAHGIDPGLDAGQVAALSAIVAAVVIALYNFLVNLLATKVHPLFGILLGVPTQPQYPDASLTANKTIAGEVVEGPVD